jgi:nitrogen regulatory protein PII
VFIGLVSQWWYEFCYPRLAHAKARRQLPDIFISKDYDLVFKVNEAVNGAGVLDMSPCELFGFGAGSFDVSTVAVAKDDPNHKIPFTIASDTSHIVVVPNEDDDGAIKELKPLCLAVADGLQERGLADMGIKYYKLTPVTRNGQTGQATEVRLRYDVTPNRETTVFVPDAAVDTEATSIMKKHHSMGCCFVGNLEKLPSETCSMVWECSCDPSPPPSFKPLKVKYWFVCKTKLQPNKFYKAR